MCEEHLLVVTCHPVGVSVEDEPPTADGVIDEEVLSVFESIAPWVEGGFNGVDVSFTSTCCFREANGNVRVVRSFREEGEEARVLVGTEESTKCALVEVTRRLDSCWELRITGYTRNEVVAVLRLDVDAVGDESIEVAAVVHLVRLNDEAVVISGPLGVVTRFGVDADGLEARSIVVGGERIVVGCRGVSTTCDFKFIADAVAVGVAEASAVAIVSGFCVFARAVVVVAPS